jgi:hypothetical protein
MAEDEPADLTSDRDVPVKPAPLPLPIRRCLTKEQAADYLGIGVTLLLQIGPPPIKFGRRSVWDLVDLDGWLDQYKGRGRAGKEVVQWPVQEESTAGGTPDIGGSMLSYRTAGEYAEALKPRAKRTP